MNKLLLQYKLNQHLYINNTLTFNKLQNNLY